MDTGKYTDEYVATLRAAFERVENKDHWKNPINVVLELTEADKLAIREAVIFYTGSVPRFTLLTGSRYRVRAAGYYATIGA